MVRAESKPRTIARHPGILHGEPTIEGIRIPVRAAVLVEHEYRDIAGIRRALPSLSASNIEKALRYYLEHWDEINAHIAENNEGEDFSHNELAPFGLLGVAQW